LSPLPLRFLASLSLAKPRAANRASAAVLSVCMAWRRSLALANAFNE
jgi:hypothetical protein